MIILDTNVISETMRVSPEKKVIEWLDKQPIHLLFISAITLAEIRCGIALLPNGKKKQKLTEDFEEKIMPLFIGKILSFDANSTFLYAKIRSHATQKGYGISSEDALIAAIAAQHGFMVATRDTTPFIHMGIEVINPWDS